MKKVLIVFTILAALLPTLWLPPTIPGESGISPCDYFEEDFKP